jgi:hypothetical protein
MTPEHAARRTYTLVDTAGLADLLAKWRREVRNLEREADEYSTGLYDAFSECVEQLENLLAGKKP